MRFLLTLITTLTSPMSGKIVFNVNSESGLTKHKMNFFQWPVYSLTYFAYIFNTTKYILVNFKSM